MADSTSEGAAAPSSSSSSLSSSSHSDEGEVQALGQRLFSEPQPASMYAAKTMSVIVEPSSSSSSSPRGALLVGPYRAASDPSILAQHKVRLVVQCAEEYTGSIREAILAFAEDIERGPSSSSSSSPADSGASDPSSSSSRRRARVLELSMTDSDVFKLEAVLEHALPAMAATRDAGDAVVVNCAMGRSRSVAVAAAHLMSYDRLSLVDALTLLRERRPVSTPNFGFCAQLMRLEGRWTGRTTVPAASLRVHTMALLNFDDRGEAEDYARGYADKGLREWEEARGTTTTTAAATTTGVEEG
jgi:hypothetical protein